MKNEKGFVVTLKLEVIPRFVDPNTGEISTGKRRIDRREVEGVLEQAMEDFWQDVNDSWTFYSGEAPVGPNPEGFFDLTAAGIEEIDEAEIEDPMSDDE